MKDEGGRMKNRPGAAHPIGFWFRPVSQLLVPALSGEPEVDERFDRNAAFVCRALNRCP
jgi:hypothetical protein